jgi:hypothetical protein
MTGDITSHRCHTTADVSPAPQDFGGAAGSPAPLARGVTVAEDDGEARAPERREERGVREQRVQRVGRVPVPRLELRRRRVLELRLGLRLRLGYHLEGGRDGTRLRCGRVTRGGGRRERARGPCRQARARRGRAS